MRPILFSLFDNPIYSYPLLMGIGWGLGLNSAKQIWIKDKQEHKVFNIVFIGAFIFSWIGAKVFFLLFSSPDKIVEYGTEINFWLGGGFVFYGGLVFALLYMLIFSYFSRTFKLIDLSLFIPALLLAHSIGRIGCFLAGCCFGKQCPLGALDNYPVQLMESASLFLLYYSSNIMIQRGKKFQVIILYLCGYSTLRFMLEFLRGDGIRGLHYGLSTSQWVSLSLLVTAGFVFAIRFFRSRRI